MHRHGMCGPPKFTMAEIRQKSISARGHWFESGQCLAGEPSDLSGRNFTEAAKVQGSVLADNFRNEEDVPWKMDRI